MGEPTPRSGVFVGRGKTPLDALYVAAKNAREYYAGGDARRNRRWEAAFSLSEIEFISLNREGEEIFVPEDHYNCRLFIGERHKGG